LFVFLLNPNSIQISTARCQLYWTAALPCASAQESWTSAAAKGHLVCHRQQSGTTSWYPGAGIHLPQAGTNPLWGCLGALPNSRMLDIPVPRGKALSVGIFGNGQQVFFLFNGLHFSRKHWNRYGSVKSAHRRTGKIKGIERILGAVDTLQESLIEVTSGQAKYEHHHRAIVWRCPRLPKEGQGELKLKFLLLYVPYICIYEPL